MSATPRRANKADPADNAAAPANKPRMPRARKLKDEEAKLDQVIRDTLGKEPEDYTPQQWRGLREHNRLNLLYPGSWVAFRDHWEGEGYNLTLVRREVLFVSRSLGGLHRQMRKIPDEQQWDVMLWRVAAPDELPWL